jgi:hypothetical protein
MVIDSDANSYYRHRENFVDKRKSWNSPRRILIAGSGKGGLRARMPALPA